MIGWLQQYGGTILLVLFVLGIVFRNPLLSFVFKIEDIDAHQLAQRLHTPEPPLVLDVRTPEEFREGHLAKALSAPLSDLKGRVAGLIKKHGDNRQIVVMCRSGNRSVMGSVILKRAGFRQVANLSGGILHWEQQGYAVQR